MIAKKNWFRIRKFGGWGVTPATKEGWAYVTIFVLIMALIQTLSVTMEMKGWIMYTLVALLLVDIGTVMMFLDKDEREKTHEAIAERNASWAMVVALLGGISYKAIWLGEVDLVYLAIILTGAVVKSLTFIYLRNK